MKNILASLPTTLRLPGGIVLLFITILISFSASGRDRDTLKNAVSLTITNYEVLPDKGYDLIRILKDRSLKFKNDSLLRSEGDHYWARLSVVNPYSTDEPYVFSLAQPVNYRLYYFDEYSRKWIGHATGLNVADGRRRAGIVKLVLPKRSARTIYLKISIKDVQGAFRAIKPAATFEKEFTFNADEQFISLIYIFCCVALICFAGYYLYAYFELKDKAYLYYVITQCGALIYISGHRFFINLIPLRVYSIKLKADGTMLAFTLNSYIDHIGPVFIFWGFLHFTRSYLNTKGILPGYDRLLKVLAYVYLGIETLFPTLTLLHVQHFETAIIANIITLVILTTVIATGVVAHDKGVKTAKIFLAANLVPMIFAAGTSISIIYDRVDPLLPALAILSQIFTFALALVARLKLINGDLKIKEIEAVKLEKDLTITQYQRLLIEEENKTIALTVAFEKERNELLQQQLEANQRELVGNSLYIHQKNKLLADLKTHVKHIDTADADAEILKSIRTSLNGGQHFDDEWDKFKLHFESVHPRFFSDLQAANPSLTRNELRLYAYFHIKLSTKEIAALLNIAPTSVRQAKMRLFKKLAK